MVYVASSATTVPESLPPILPDPRREVWIAGDESGTLQFNDQAHDRFFLVATVTVENNELWADLRSLERELNRRSSRTGLPKPFHANKDTSDVRQRVVDLMLRREAIIEATVLDKMSVPADLRKNALALYTIMWTGHLTRFLPRHLYPNPLVTLLLAELGALSRVDACEMAVNNATGRAYLPHVLRAFHGRWDDPPVENVYDAPALRWMWGRAADELAIQVADYAAWAIHRKWEGDDDRWYRQLQPLIREETVMQLPPGTSLASFGRTPKRGRRDAAQQALAGVAVPPRPTSELIARSRNLQPAEASLDELSRALILQARSLDEYGEDSAVYIEIGDEVIRLAEAILVQSPDDQLAKELVVMTMYNQAIKLDQLGREPDSVDLYSRLVHRFGDDPDPDIQRHIARALVNRSNRLQDHGQKDEARDGYETVIAKFGHRHDRPMSEALAKSYVFSAELLNANQCNEAMRRLSIAFDLIGVDEYDRVLRPLRGRSLVRRGQVALANNQDDRGIDDLNEVIRLFGGSRDEYLLLWVAEALAAKAKYVYERHMYNEALALYERAAATLAQSKNRMVRIRLLRILGTRSSIMVVARPEDAQAALEETRAEGGMVGGNEARLTLAIADFDDASLRKHAGDVSGARQVLQRLVKEYSTDPEPQTQECVRRAREQLKEPEASE
jgi:tetratricopeptide (TPR) repeat protein